MWSRIEYPQSVAYPVSPLPRPYLYRQYSLNGKQTPDYVNQVLLTFFASYRLRGSLPARLGDAD